MSLYVQIKKKLGSFLLDVAFDAEDEILALLGPSGCGKSMTLKCIAGVETPDEGTNRMNGRVLYDSAKKINLPPQERRVGYLFQQYALFPQMTVLQNVAAACRKRDKAARMDFAREMLSRFRLSPLADHFPNQLSGGQQQRTALARIFANEPEALLLDEPFSSLDSYLRWQLELELVDLLDSFSGASVFVSHSRNEVYRLCHSVCVLNDGSSEPQISVKSLFEAPQTFSSCLLSGCKNFSRIVSAPEYDRKLGELTTGTLTTSALTTSALTTGALEALDWGCRLHVSSPSSGFDFIGIRAHHLSVADGPGVNTLYCEVSKVIEDVFSIVIMLSTPGQTSLLRLEMQKELWPRYQDRNFLYVYMNPAHLMLLRK